MWAAAVSMLATGSAAAQGQPASGHRDPWALVLAALRDDEAYETLIAGVRWGVAAETWLGATVGRSKAPSNETDVVADVFEIGIEHDFGPVGLSAEVEHWGDSGDLESSNRQLGIFVRDDRYRVELDYEQRAIDIYFAGALAPLSTDRRRASLDAEGFGLAWRVRPVTRWQVYGAWRELDYPPRIGLVPRAERLGLLSASAATLAYSFMDQYLSVGVERSLGLKLLDFGLSSNRSAIDGDRLDSLDAAMLWPIAARMDVELRLGTSRSDSAGSALFGGLTFFYYGG